MKVALLVALATTLGGCATLEGRMDNRLACTLAKDKAYLVSEYGPVGVSATISAKDAAVICAK